MSRSVASLKRDPQFGLDSRWSWITAGFLSWVLFICTASVRVAGVLFYGIIDTYGVSRQLASWPVTLNGCLLNLAGPVMGLLCRRFSCRIVLLTCSFITGLAICVCYFAEGVLFLNVFFGLVHGITLSGVFVGVNVLVSQHFEKRRITACSMIFTFCGLNTFFAPPLVEYFRTTYGLRGSFLLLGAIILNTFPGTIALHSPPWISRSAEPSPPPKARRVELLHKMAAAKHTSLLSQGKEKINDNPGIRPIAAPRRPSAAQIARSAVMDDWMGSVSSFGALDFGVAPQTDEEQGGATRPLSLKDTARQFLTAAFLVDALSFTIVIFSMGTFVLLCVDLARDRGILPSDAVYLLHAFTAGDITLRAMCGFVIDSKLLSLEAVMFLGYLVQAFAFEFLVWAGTFPMLVICSVLMGVSSGSRVPLQAPTLIHDFGVESLPVMMGGMVFCIGAGSLARPPLVGYYRDQHGSYDGLFHIMAVINVLLLGVWALKLALSRRKCSTAKEEDVNKERRHSALVPVNSLIIEDKCNA
ncbi:monocarboxylate transporter 9-like [Haemaphysalis longicornis]